MNDLITNEMKEILGLNYQVTWHFYVKLMLNFVMPAWITRVRSCDQNTHDFAVG